MFKIVAESGERLHFGSGVVINSRGHALTALHVLRPDDAYSWIPPYALLPTESERLPLKVLKTSPEHDLALLALPAGRVYPALRLQDRPIESGEAVFSLGYPGGVQELAAGITVLPSRRASIVDAFTAFNRRVEPLTYRTCVMRDDIVGRDVSNGNVVSTNHSDHGSSGGAVLTEDGTLAGIVVAFKRNPAAIQADLMEVTGIDLKDFNMPPRLTIARSTPQIRSFLDS